LTDRRAGKKPQPGLLVGCREAKFFGEGLRVGDELLVTARALWTRPPVASFAGEVKRGGEVLAKVEVSVVDGVSVAAFEAGNP
jgi:predicted hotdog family 3-hydroxylacyl-ACP dehydratase